jgi:hypothetical protein
MDEGIVSMVLLPGAIAVLLALLATWAWTHDYEEIAAEMQRAIREEDKETTVGILWRRAGVYFK